MTGSSLHMQWPLASQSRGRRAGALSITLGIWLSDGFHLTPAGAGYGGIYTTVDFFVIRHFPTPSNSR
jgi:hypothetical protein